MAIAAGFPKLSLVLGGARSGKSAFAETLAGRFGGPKHYLATASASDPEMQARIAAHVARRGADWTTVETGANLAGALAALPAESVALVDCLTLWLGTLTMAEADITAETLALRTALAQCPARVICVSNEIGLGLVPETALGRSFRDAHGHLNQLVATQADLAVFVAAGLPMVLKGTLPGPAV